MARVGSKGQVRSRETRSKTRNKICRLGRIGGRQVGSKETRSKTRNKICRLGRVGGVGRVGSKGQVGSRETRSKTRNKICRLGRVGGGGSRETGVGRVQAGRQ